MLKHKLYYLFTLLLISCGGGSDEPAKQTDSQYIKEVVSTAQSNLSIPNNEVTDHYQVLLLGNSHVQSLASMIKHLIAARFAEKQITTSSALGVYFLSERLEDRTSVERLVNSPWTHVILQAQKYSSSGAFTYPTDAAVTWIQLAKTQNTTPIMFPEHPPLGDAAEAVRVHLLHESIAEEESVCVAPIGLAWNRAIKLYPELDYHQADGNHASTTGKFLTAAVFYQIITGELADSLPYIEAIDVDEATQALLREVASYTLAQNLACEY